MPKAHYRGSYPLRRKRMFIAIATGNVRAAYAEAPHLFPGDLATAKVCLCWRCGEPLLSCGPNRNGRHKNGRPAKWTSGHTVDGDSSKPIVPECSPCNYRFGASAGNRRRGRGGSNLHRRARRRKTPPSSVSLTLRSSR